MKRTHVIVTGVAAVCLSFAPTSGPEPAVAAPRLKEAPRGTFLGTWRQHSAVFDGNDITEANRPARLHWVVTETTITIYSAGGVNCGHWTYALDPNKSPAELDLTTKVGGKPVTYPCIYKVEGDELTVCLQNFPERGRPKKFETHPESGIIMTVHKRAKAGDEKGRDLPAASR
jgi:uncharacterized protein (TIGR03067 family)